MAEQNKPFVVTDRRKFSLDGSPRPDYERPEPEPEPAPIAETPAPAAETSAPAAEALQPEAPAPEPHSDPEADARAEFPPLTASEMEQASRAYESTTERLDTAIRASNPGADHLPKLNFESIVQSIYMTTLMQLGGNTPEGQQPRVDLMGARQSIDMLGILAEKTSGSLNHAETQLMNNALFELRMGFLEVTQALARASAPPPGGAPGAPGTPAGGFGPKIVR